MTLLPSAGPLTLPLGVSSDGLRGLTLGELQAWGMALGEAARAPRIITLSGDLGTGKTTLVQAIVQGYGVTEPVTSPTYALVHEYASDRSPVYHLDLYRLRDVRDLLHIGWSDIVERPALILIEWPDRAGAYLPAGATAISLSHVADDSGRRGLSVHVP